jgi:hypothetical protein
LKRFPPEELTQLNPGPDTATKIPFYTWQPPQKPINIQLHFDVVDRLLLEVMKGFGAVPRRGAEVGGFLLGTRDQSGDHLTVEIHDFEPILCEHAEGPSFILSANDLRLWNETIARLQASGRQIVGFYRSHTRDGLHLAEEDLNLLNEYFPNRDLVSLIVKPYATRASVAGFFFWEGDSLRSDSTYLEFPFRRKELGGGVSPLDRVVTAARFGQQQSRSTTGAAAPPAAPASPLLTPTLDPPPAPLPDPAKAKPARSGWVWIPLSFIFMLLGVILGFQIAISMRPRTPANPYLEAWNLALGVQRLEDRLVVSWDRTAPAVRNANRGVMTILAGDDSRRIDLSFNDLQAGQLIYRSSPSTVIFRLEVYPKDRTSVAETLEYRQAR